MHIHRISDVTVLSDQAENDYESIQAVPKMEIQPCASVMLLCDSVANPVR